MTDDAQRHYGTEQRLLPPLLLSSHIAVLRFEEHRRAARDSVWSLPVLGTRVDWSGRSDVLQQYADDDAEMVRLLAETLTGEDVPRSDVFVLWGNLAIPSLRLSCDLAVTVLASIVDTFPDFWLYVPESGLLVECLQDGRITSTHLQRAPEGSAVEP